jgi:hypothetical protein
MFPYGIIIASNLLRRKGDAKSNPPKIETLKYFTDLPAEDFYKILVENSQKVGLLEMAEMISCWQNFDDLSDKKKKRFVTETLDPDYYSLKNNIKRFEWRKLFPISWHWWYHRNRDFNVLLFLFDIYIWFFVLLVLYILIF